ncbi:Nn.00g117970.m01.CDS01 [Neocucurbitaria sp. VM-36]
MLKASLFTFATFASIASLAAPVSGQNTSDLTQYPPPALVPFLHLDWLVGFPYNGTTVDGIVGFVPTLGGNVTGSIEGDILPVGASREVMPPLGDGGYTFYENSWIINTTDTHQPIIMSGRATIAYANNALRGFGSVSFASDAPEYLDLNFRNFVAEFEGTFFTGTASMDVFELVTTRN